MASYDRMMVQCFFLRPPERRKNRAFFSDREGGCVIHKAMLVITDQRLQLLRFCDNTAAAAAAW